MTQIKSYRSPLLTSCAIMALCISDIAAAQETNEPIEEILITGSRIRQSPLENSRPVQILGEEDIDASGMVSIADFLQRLPIAGSAINRTNNSSGNLGFPPDGSGIGAGASQIDLRYLSSKRVLVLVDGKRWVRGSSASGVSGAVDLNTIPTGMIKTVEVLQDGASTVYGSDAIAGVVNIKTRDDYEGLRASAYYGLYDEGDGKTQEYDISWGADSDKARILANVSYTEQGSVEARDRELSAFAIPFEMLGASSGTPQGRFVIINPMDGETYSITPNDGTGPIPMYDPANPEGADYHAFTINDRFNYSPFNKLMTPNSRLNFFVKAEYDLTDEITYRMTATYNNRRSVSQAAPEPLFIGPEAGAGFWMDNMVVPDDHPFNPFGFQLDSDTLVFAGRRPIEAGPRIFKQNVDTWVISNTFDGSFEAGDRQWYFDLNLTWAQNQANQSKTGAFNGRKIQDALGDPAACALIPNCVPFNYFGGQNSGGTGTITQAMLDYITFIQKDESEQTLFDVSGNVSGDLFDMPAGPVGIAIGWEYRKEEGFFIPDSVVSSGETAGVPASPTDGSVSVKEGYGELNIPLLSDMDMVKLFSVNGAVRYSDYDVSGSSTVFKFGALWQVNDDLSLRGSWSEGLRAPNIGELFNSGSRFDSSILDPCSGATGATATQCAALGIPAGYTQNNTQIGVTTGGNPNLIAEEAKTFTAGFTYNPLGLADGMGLQGITIEANYYDISMTDTIQAPNASDVLESCVNTLDDFFCDAVIRVSTGAIIRIDGVLTNIAGIDTHGADWSIGAETHVNDWGQLRFKWMNSHLISYKETTPTPDGTQTIERAGTELGSPERAFVKFKSTLIIDWTKNEWLASLTGRYMSGFGEDCGGTLGDFEFTEHCTPKGDFGNWIPSRTYVDAQVTYTPEALDQRVGITLGVQNLTKTSMPLCTTCDLNNSDGTIHPIDGRYFYGRATLKF